MAASRAVRWAITSAVHSADTPTSTLLLIPAWQHSSLTCLLAHPLVTRQHCVISFHPPEHLSGSPPPCLQTSFTVHPAGGIGGTNTVTRAELAGIYAALSHEATSHTRLTNLNVFCDSLACLYLEQTAQYSPHTLRECKHAPLLMHIRSLVLARAKLGYHTHFQKVPSHCGIVGNELADKGAALALKTPPGACFSNLTHICPNYLNTLPAWPHLPPPHTPYIHPLVDLSHVSLWQAPDLNMTIK